MLTLSEIRKSFGGRTLFSGVSLQINPADRIGLVGPNGAGKTTLFSLLLGDASPDEGSITMEKRATVGFLPQESAPVGDETVLELAMSASDDLQALKQTIRAYESGKSADLEAYHEARERFDILGGERIEPVAKKILAGLAFRESDFSRPVAALSGGWVMRVHLARLLVMEPDLLLLDEPTNHLDLHSLQWLQNYLKGYPGAILVISHDREFLNQIVNSIIEIRHGRLERYQGGFDDYLVQREQRDILWRTSYENQQKEIERLQRFADRFRAKASKASQAQSKLKQIDRIEKIEKPPDPAGTVHFRFPQPPRSGRKVINLEGVHHAYGENVVYRGIDFAAERGQRIVLVGPNGAGKSTLLKLLAGVLPVQKGTRELGMNVKPGYYSQYRTDTLDTSNTVLDEALSIPSDLLEKDVRTLLGCFLFSGDDAFKKVRILSGGEKSRLALVKLLIDPPNLLLMDEPTTHLDMGSIDALTTALEQFQGTFIFISHDVHFIRAIANQVLHVEDGELTLFHGDYDYYLRKSGREAVAGLTATGQSGSRESAAPSSGAPAGDGVHFKSREKKREEAATRQAMARERKEWQEKVSSLEKKVIALEEEQQKLADALEDPGTYNEGGQAARINRDLTDVTVRLEQVTAEWEKAVEEGERFEIEEPSG